MSKFITRILILVIFANLVFGFIPLSTVLIILSFVLMFALLVVYYFQEYIMNKSTKESICKSEIKHSIYCCFLKEDSTRSLIRGYLCFSDKNVFFIEKINKSIVFKRPISTFSHASKTKEALRDGYKLYFESISDDYDVITLTGRKLLKDKFLTDLVKK